MKKLFCLVTVWILCLVAATPCTALSNPDERFREALGTLDDTYGGDTVAYMAAFMTERFTPSYVSGEEGPLYIAAAPFETLLSLYVEVDLTFLRALRSELPYDEERDAYRIEPFSAVNGSLPAREYRGYVPLGENRYEVYYEALAYELLEDILSPEDPFWNTVGNIGFGETVTHQGAVYEYHPEDGFYRVTGASGYGYRYTVEYLSETDTVRILSAHTFAQGEMPAQFGPSAGTVTESVGEAEKEEDNAKGLGLREQMLLVVAVSAVAGFGVATVIGLLRRRR